jgi:hypothetical protein
MSLISKEFKAITRNSRFAWLLLMSFLIPFAVFFMLFRFSGQLIQQQIDGTNNKKFKVAWISKGTEGSELKSKLKNNFQIVLIDSLDEEQLQEAVEVDSISVGIIIAENFDSSIAKQEKAGITLYFKGQGRALAVVEKTIAAYRREISKRNIKDSKLPDGIVNPIEITENDLSSIQEIIDNVSEMLNRTVAVLLSLLLYIFGVMGARFALNQLFWSERISGVGMYYQQSVLGKARIFSTKIITASLTSFVMMFLSILGFAMAISIDQGGIIQGIIIQLKEMLHWKNIGMIMLIALPLGLVFTGFWAMFRFLFADRLAGFLANLAYLIILILLVSSAALSSSFSYSSAFTPFLNLGFFIKALMSEELGVQMIFISCIGALLWGLLFNIINSMIFRKY